MDQVAYQATQTLMDLGCDSVRIIYTMQPGVNQAGLGTQGKGNWFAQIGSVEQWLRERKAYTNAVEIAELINPPPGDEGWKND